MVSPHSKRREILVTIHSTYKVVDSTLPMARANFWWPRMSAEVKSMVESCVTCKEYKHVPRKKLGNEGLVDIRCLEPMESISMDLGYIGILKPFIVVVDKFSGFKAT